MKGFLTLGIAASLLAGSAFAQIPGGLDQKEYLGRRLAQTMHYTGAGWLIRTKRDREEAASTMREELRLKPGMVVCDMGSGNGYHTLPMAESVAPGGKAYAVDIQPEMLQMLEDRAERFGVENIETILGGEKDARLPAGSCDLILMVDVYHEFSFPAEMLTSMKEALAPGGQLVLVEYRKEDDSVPIKPDHKMFRKQILKELNANGFRLTRSFDELPWQHMMWFGREEEATNGAAVESEGTDHPDDR